MTKNLRISREVSLPLDVVTKTVAILAQRRKGKTYTASVIAEEMVAAGVPFVALDPTGAWWGLRSSRDGGPGGLPVVVLGGQHGDIPIDRTAGRAVADLVVDEPGWYIIDFSLFESGAAERQFATDFAERLYRRKGQPNSDFPLHLFVDEADRFVPQTTRGGRGEARETDARMLGAFEAIVRRGGLRGLGSTLISQRAAIVNKNVLEQIDMLIALRVVGPNDRNAIDDYLKADADNDQRRVMMGSIASLDIGEAWFWEPGGEPPLFTRAHIRERHTFNSSATPKPGQKRIEPRVFAAVDLDAIKNAMAATIERNLADDPNALRRRIADLERQLKTAVKQPPVTVAPVVEIQVERVDVPVLDEQLIIRLEQALQPVGVLAAEIGERLTWEVTQRGELIEFERRAKDTRSRVSTAANTPITKGSPPTARPTARSEASSPTDGISKTERNVLTVLVLHGALTHAQIALLSGYSVKASTIGVALSKLRKAGLVDSNGQPVRATTAGVEFLGSAVEPLPEGKELLDYWRTRFGLTEQRVLDALVAVWPRESSLNEVAKMTGYSAAASTIGVAMSKLRKVGVVDRWALSADFAQAVMP